MVIIKYSCYKTMCGGRRVENGRHGEPSCDELQCAQACVLRLSLTTEAPTRATTTQIIAIAVCASAPAPSLIARLLFSASPNHSLHTTCGSAFHIHNYLTESLQTSTPVLCTVCVARSHNDYPQSLFEVRRLPTWFRLCDLTKNGPLVGNGK